VRAEALLPHLPERRALLHGDYSLDNILADAGQISGVIDWGSCCYGDPLRDVAWVEFWAPQLGFAAAYLAAGPPEPDADTRLACYRACIAARALGFYLHVGQREAAGWVVDVESR
jgi:aminoglycoside phosphotransferase (APT) family kinase protein